MKWTKPQSDAIYDNGGTLLVSAAAGSGKTAVLTERAVRLLCDAENPIAADRLLIVTFTRAAAEELRARISSRLMREQAKSPNNIFLRRQRFLLTRASICTIDAFCMQLLKQYFAELSLPPDFDKADEALIKSLREQTITQVMEQMYLNTDFCAFAAMYGRSRSDEGAKSAILNLYDFLRSAPFTNQTAQKIIDNWSQVKPLNETSWGKILQSNAMVQTQGLLEVSQEALKLSLCDEAMSAAYADALNSDNAFLAELLRLIHELRWDDALIYASSFEAQKLKVYKGQLPQAQVIKALREKMKKGIKKLLSDIFVCTKDEFESDMRQAFPMVKALVLAAQLFEKLFFEKKITEKSLEYSDFEHLALQLLCNEDKTKTSTAKIISKQFDAVMVDEYQDTNELQALMYSCLANDDMSNLFMVGDIKQSIYRFRLAEPRIFMEKKDTFHAFDTALHPAVITLGHNFRSSRSVINQINYIFETLMSRELGGVDYDESERLVPSDENTLDSGALELIICDTSGETQAAQDAGTIADKINKMINDKYEIVENGISRECNYGDFCILIRTGKLFLKYEKALEKKGIPVMAGAGEGLITAPEVSCVLSLLQVIDNPAQDIHLAAVMLSPMYSYTPSELTLLRAKSRKESIYSVLLNSSCEKDKLFCEELAFYRAMCASAAPNELLNEILRRTQYMAAVSAMRNSASRRENLRSFIAFAVQGCKAAGSLSSFLRRLAAMDNKLPQQQSAFAVGNCVRIMTIHKSKGLEFPVCILANTQGGFNFRELYSPVLFDSKLGLGLCLAAKDGGLYHTAAHRAIFLSQKKDSISEELRVLYVALTRAKHKIIITMSLKNTANYLRDLGLGLCAGKNAAYAMLQNAQDMSPWVCAAAILHSSCDNLRKEVGDIILPVVKPSCDINAQIVTWQDAELQKSVPILSNPILPNQKVFSKLNTSFEKSKALSLRPVVLVKQSVSALSKQGLPSVLSRPSFMYAQGLTSAERGTAMHEFLLYANLENAKIDLLSEINRLVENAYISRDIADKLYKNDILLFLNSFVCGRILNAEKVLREYDFITSICGENGASALYVQGIADVVLINGSEAEIIDYKTDKGKTAEQLVADYSSQLLLYKSAIQKRLCVRVSKLTIYSFSLNEEIEVIAKEHE